MSSGTSNDGETVMRLMPCSDIKGRDQIMNLMGERGQNAADFEFAELVDAFGFRVWKRGMGAATGITIGGRDVDDSYLSEDARQRINHALEALD